VENLEQHAAGIDSWQQKGKFFSMLKIAHKLFVDFILFIASESL
jgi:hypothetical protein